MLQPNVFSSYLLKRWRLEDSCGAPSMPPETSFPDYEVISTAREGCFLEIYESRIPLDLERSCATTQNGRPNYLPSPLNLARSRSTRCNAIKDRISAWYPNTHIEINNVSVARRHRLGSVIFRFYEACWSALLKSWTIPAPVSISLRAATLQLSRSQREWLNPTSEKGV